MQNLSQTSKTKKVISLYLILVLGFLIFLGVMLHIAISPRYMPSLYAKTIIHAKRGAIITSDGYAVAVTQKLYKAVVNTLFIKPNKKNLFIKLFSIYSGMKESLIKKRLNSKHGVVVLSYKINLLHAQNLKDLGKELLQLKVFKAIKSPITHAKIIQGLNIIASGEARVYPFKNFLTPVLGYTHKIEKNGYTTVHGIKGLEKEYDQEMSPHQNLVESGSRDVNNYIILNGKSTTIPLKNGINIKLNINANIQYRIENLLDKMKQRLQAKEIVAVVMFSNNGKILALASSNRYLPQNILKKDYASLNNTAIEFPYAPGSVLKPLTFALLLQEHLVNPYELINGHNGVYHLGRMTITDDEPFAWLSAQNVIVYSSNIGMSQLAQRLSGINFYNGLKTFGLTYKTGIDLPYEYAGSIPSPRQLSNQIYKATTSYGYGVKITLIQLIKAYNAFNNHGIMVTPRIISAFINPNGKITKIPMGPTTRAISASTALIMKRILIKVVNKGTAKTAIIPGLTIGGKTGTAHITKHGKYINQYNSTFIGFVDNNKSKYTIGILVKQPQVRDYYAAGTAVPVFKKIVDVLIAQHYLNPNYAIKN